MTKEIRMTKPDCLRGDRSRNYFWIQEFAFISEAEGHSFPFAFNNPARCKNCNANDVRVSTNENNQIGSVETSFALAATLKLSSFFIS